MSTEVSKETSDKTNDPEDEKGIDFVLYTF